MLKGIYRSLFYTFTEILHKHDPVVGTPFLPPDEYASEARQILARSNQANSSEELAEIVRSVFFEMFNDKLAGHVVKYRKIAEEMWQALERYGLQ